MERANKYFVTIYIAVLVVAIVTGIIFYNVVVGNGSTNIFSVIFGWQWIYLAVISIAVLIVAPIKRNRRLAWAGGIMAVSLALVLIPARLVESSGMYITGEGGPAGPEFACLVWNDPNITLHNGSYGNNLGLCTVLSIPSYNKFLIDRSRDADQLDATPTFYMMLAVNEIIILGGGLLARRRLTSKSVS